MTDWKKTKAELFEEDLEDAEIEDGVEIVGEERLDASERPIAYIRPVSRDELSALPPDAPKGPYYALHDGEGRPLALFTDPHLAAAAARSNQLSPVSVH